MLSSAKTVTLVVLLAFAACAQEAYKPKFEGDPARSNDEALALGYMRTLLAAQRIYKKQHNRYATRLEDLVNKGSFTRRMTKTDRGAYQVRFHGTADKFSLSLTPQHFDQEHRAFFADQTGKIRAESDKPATAASSLLKGSP